MWRLLVLGLVVLAVDAPAAWYLEDREGTVAADEVRCEFFDPAWPHLQIRENGTTWDLVVVNPTEYPYSFWGAESVQESWRVRWDGRLAPGPAMATSVSDRVEPREVPPGGEMVAWPVGPHPWEPGEHVLRAQMEGLCGVARVRVA